MNRLRSLAAFGYNFLVGDDPTVAAGVVLTLALTAAVTATGAHSWWLPLLAVPALIGLGVVRAIRRARGDGEGNLPSPHPERPLR